MTDFKTILTKLEGEIRNIDKAKDRFKYLSWTILIGLAVLGIVVAANESFGWQYTNILLGILTAALGAIQKGVDPGVVAEKLKNRKRALELIHVEVNYHDYGGRLTPIEAERLIVKSKEDPVEVLELLANFGRNENVS